jgi:gliding motility-associated-like protein
LVLTDGDIYHDLGSLHTNNFNLSILAGSYVSSNFALYTNPRRLDLGSSTITCQGFNILTDNYILDPNTSTINLSYGINYSLYSIATGVAHMPLHNINFMPIGITNYINAYYESPSIRVHPTFNSVKFNGNGSMYGQLNIDSVFFSYGSSYSITTSISPVVFWSDTINTINSIGNCGNSISIFSGNSLAADIIKIDSTVQNPVELFNFVIQNIHISSSGVSPFYAFQSSDLGGNQNWVVYSSGLGFPTSNILNNDTSLCESLGTILFSVDSIYPWSINNYWSLPAGASTNDSLSNAAINILNNPFNGNLIFTSDFGCGTFTHDTIYVEIDAQPDLAIAGADQSYCLTDSAISVILNANNPTIGIGEWSGTPNTIFSDSSLYNTTASNLSEGENVLVWTVTNGACPPSIDSIIITIDTIITNVNAYIMDSSQLCSQHIITLQADSSIGTWTTIAGEGEITSANSIITNVNNLSIGLNSFLWTVATPFGICPAAADTVSMFYGSDNCLELFIPDGFSPNDDNNHDTWIIYGLPPNTDMSVEIYNRWGNLIYKNEHYDNSWNGNSNSGLTVGNEKAPEGTFYYILNIENYPDTFVGYITLWR